MSDWYNTIEPGIREVVRLLRDNGINTTCSCEHEMIVQFDVVWMEDVDRAYNALVNNGHHGFRIETQLHAPPDGFPTRRATIYLSDWL